MKVLHHDLVEILITFGFEIKQILIAFKEYKFTNIDEACYVFMKDNENGKYYHLFIPRSEKTENSNYDNYNKIYICIICKGDPTEHSDFDF